MRRKSKLVCGVGINDADYIVQPTVNGKRVNCVFYIEWVGMISRCYNEKKLSRVNTYEKCFVCDEWLTFSSFKEWMKNQDYKGNHLDKDILFEGNKVYSPNTCAFVKRSTNNLLNDRGNHRGKYPLGSHLNKNSGKLVVRCKDGKGKQIYLGAFNVSERLEAYHTYLKFKSKVIANVAYEQIDNRVKDALIKRSESMIYSIRGES